MKFFVALVGLASLALGVPPALQQPEPADFCRFTLSGNPVKSTIAGPEDITPLVYVIDQPDSPIEIVSLDFTGYVLSVANERFTFRECSTMRIRNRSDQVVSGLGVVVHLSSKGFWGGGGFAGHLSASGLGASGLGAGQETELRLCNGSGTGDAPGNRVHIFAFVDQVGINRCIYIPSRRIPFELAAN